MLYIRKCNLGKVHVMSFTSSKGTWPNTFPKCIVNYASCVNNNNAAYMYYHSGCVPVNHTASDDPLVVNV